MRYIIDTKDEQGIIGMAIGKWQKEKLIDLIEKGEPIIEIQAQLERVAKALEILKKAGYNSEVMKAWIQRQTRYPMEKINVILGSQEEFFRQIGIIPKKIAK